MRCVGSVHPEFGYFCPAPAFRCALRIALSFVLFGAFIGTARFIGRNATNELGGFAASEQRLATSGGGRRPYITADSMGQVEEGETPMLEYDKIRAAKMACDGNSSGYSDDTCLRRKLRRVLVAVENSPAIARVPIGQTAAPSAGSSATGRSDTTSENSLVAAPPGSSAALTENRPSVAGPKKSQKTARSESRRHTVSGDNARRYDARVDQWVHRRYANYDDYARGRFGRGSLYVSSYDHRGSSAWSW